MVTAGTAWRLGIFAHEIDLVGLPDLGQALVNWSRRPQASLVSMLVEQGSLDEADVPLLEAMWTDRTAEPHDQSTLAPVDPASAARAELEPVEEWTVQEGLPKDHEGPPVRFEILETLARGGLGKVSVAFDHDLNRRVAVKQIDARFAANPLMQERFLREAEIMGSLEHPAIVPVHAIGVDDDGVPFYAMRLLENRTLADVVAQLDRRRKQPGWFSSVGFRRLVGQFLDVCRAIGYAHSKGIVHRDIKPANIILGGHGETMVVDWGLARRFAARAIDDDAEAGPPGKDDAPELTVEGAALGTPAYMSPEQASGRKHELGPPCDVFGLGATLYFLLTGQAPYRGATARESVELAVRGNFPLPRTVEPGVPRALEAVVCKAMNMVPAGRYGSPLALAADLENWLADQPVSAWREPVGQRLARLSRRHRTATRVALIAVAVLAVAGTAFSVMLGRQNSVIAGQREAARDQAKQQKLLAEKEHAARLSADRHQKLAISTLHSVIWNMQRGLAGVPAAQTVRRELLETAFAGLKDIESGIADRTLVDRDRMTAHIDIGKIYLFAGDILGGSATDRAVAHFSTARDIALVLLERDPADPEAQRDVSVAWEHLGELHLEQGNWEAAENEFRKALESSLATSELEPDVTWRQRDVAFGHEKLGDVFLRRGDVARARQAFEAAHAVYERLARATPGDFSAQRDLTVSFQKLGNLLLQEGDPEGAVDRYAAALDLIRLQVAAGSDQIQPRDESVLLNKLGGALSSQGHLPEALAAFRDGLEIAEEIAAAAPENVQAQRDWGYSLKLAADGEADNQRPAEARRLYEQCRGIRARLADMDHANAALQAELAGVLVNWAGLESTKGDKTLARELAGEARAALERVDPETISGSPAYSDIRDRVEDLLDE